MQFKLPDDLSTELRYLIYGLMIFHLLIFISYLLILMPNLLKNYQVENQQKLAI